ncbi:type III-A CRISPR-associated protein Cas10/Csm1 [Kallotenue papyrolyticum]|uniref:type III-A CRISPR-associated protein Cas10/Csm1 n=1 Tax=Kallotenue papyrolyticum TaxID=1325125 RepID=UPI0004922614|nr:type III-A CRISPR-associated protein Cas10/Csm1 [Kallotenue papyrolyticum]
MSEAKSAAFRTLRAAIEHAAATGAQAPPVQSVFSALDTSAAARYLVAGRLTLDEATLFPVDAATQARRQAPALLAELREAAAQLQADQPDAADRLFYLLQEYGWALPAGAGQDPLVSLFDQARSAAALAAARAGQADDAAVLLVGGDISGVQDFIYTITAQGATKALRARSLYLQLLSEAIARWLLRQAGMPLTNLLYSGGGHFYLLLPATCQAQVQEWRVWLSRWLLRRHAGELYVALGDCLVSDAELNTPQRFRQRWSALHQALNRDKRRRFASLPPQELAVALFQPQGPGGAQHTCVVCHYQGQPVEFVPFDPDLQQGLPPAEARRICRLCASFEELAIEARNAAWLLLEEGADREAPQRQRVSAHEVLRDLGISMRFAASPRDLERVLADRSGAITVLSLDGSATDDLRWRFPQAIWGLRPLVNVTPTLKAQEIDRLREQLDADEQANLKAGQIKTFGMLAQQSRGIKRLGVLRMDVDDLGELIATRLPDLSLARIGALSMALARFFEGWVGQVCRRLNSHEHELIYAVYSGGDDLFIVGAWHLLPDLALSIRQDLQRYAGDQISASAGISLHPNKFPLYQAARAAGNELDRAKDLPGKNALCLLEQVIGWEQAKEVFELKHDLTRLIGDGEQRGPLSRATLQVLQALYSEYRRPTRRAARRAPADQAQIGAWVWFGVYQLARMEEAISGNSEAAAAARALLRELRTNLRRGLPRSGRTAPFIELVGLAARWAQLELRRSTTYATHRRDDHSQNHR